MMRPRIMVVDDAEDIRTLVEVILTSRGFDVVSAEDGPGMAALLGSMTPDLILLDGNMPGESGFSICQRMSGTDAPPIIMLTAMDQQRYKNAGLAGGAADYVTKPFDADELTLRIRSVLRRSAPVSKQDVMTFSGWCLAKTTRVLTSPRGKSLTMTNAEFALLCVFLNSPDRPIRHSRILHEMRSVHDFSTEHALKTLVSRLRGKLDYMEPNSELIQTVYGVGYVLKPGLLNA